MRSIGAVSSQGNIPPSTPNAPTATDQGTGRTFNNGQASISFTAPTTDTKFPVTTYFVTPTPATSPTTFSGASSPITVTGLASATSYTYTISATNAIGSTSSSSSSPVTATTVPQNPTIGTATSSSGTVSIAFTPGSNGGSAITSYSVTSNPSIALSVSGTSSPLSVTGSFASATNYTFTMAAVNANGTSTSSGSSNSVMPNAGYGSYFFSMLNVGGTTYTDIGKVLFSNETVSRLGTSITSTQMWGTEPVANNKVASYVSQNSGSPLVFNKDFDKFSFPADTKTVVKSALAITRNSVASISNNGSAAYFGGGYYYKKLGDPPITSTAIEKFAYSTESSTTLAATTSNYYTQGGSFSNNGVAGYMYFGNGTSYDKLTYSTETRSSLALGATSKATSSNNGVAGYVTSYKLAYSTETWSTVSVSATATAASSNNGVAEYSNGNPSTPSNALYKRSYTTDIFTTLSAVFPSNVDNNNGTGSSNNSVAHCENI